MNPFKAHSKLATALQMVSLFAVVSAFFGFLIVNIYLALFGFWDFNFLKVQYFSAGGLFLFFIGSPAALFCASFRARNILETYRANSNSTFKSILVFFVKGLILFVMAVLSFGIFIFPLMFSNLTFPASFVTFLGVIWTAMIFGAAAMFIKARSDISDTRGREINFKNIVVYFFAHYRLLIVFLISPLFIFMFSFLIYPTVPRYFGGGKPVAVNIGFDQQFNSQQMGITNPFNAFLVYQSADSVLVLTDKGVYLLKQSDIAYIEYLEANARIRSLQYLYTPNVAISTRT